MFDVVLDAITCPVDPVVNGSCLPDVREARLLMLPRLRDGVGSPSYSYQGWPDALLTLDAQVSRGVRGMRKAATERDNLRPHLRQLR